MDGSERVRREGEPEPATPLPTHETTADTAAAESTTPALTGLVVGAADDPFEHEADRIADALLAGRPARATADVQRGHARAKSTSMRDSFDPGASFASGLAGLGSGGRLPGGLRQNFEASLGMGLGDVRVHTGPSADRLNTAIGARAFTVGSDIVVSSGDYKPGTNAGDRLLAHEVGHVAQQAGSARRKIRTIRRYMYQEIVDQFAKGDLMYGLSWARTDTQGPVKAKMRLLDTTGGNQQQAASVLDELNNFFIGTSGYNTDDAAQYGSDYGTKKANYNPDPAVQAQANTFKTWLETDPHFGPMFRGLAPVRGKALTDKHRTWERIKQVCLGGLKYTVTGGKKIYFILDDLNMSDVVQGLNYQKDMSVPFDAKKKLHDPTGDAKEDITPNELRFIYHNWSDAAFNTNISFWRRGKSVEPPWVEQPKLWQKYANEQANVADDTAKQKDVAAAPADTTAEINAIRDDVLGNFEKQKFEFATKAAARLGVTFEETTGLSRGALVKKIMGLSALDRVRESAKTLDPKLPQDQLSAAIARLAKAARTASDPTGVTSYLDSRLAMVRKVAFYLWRRAPKADVDKGLVYQAQEGVTGKTKRSESPTALLVMGPDAASRSAAIPVLDKSMKPYVHADASRFAAMLPAALERGAADDEDMVRGAAVARAAAGRAIDKNRNFVFEGSGDDIAEFGDMLDRLRQLDYRVMMAYALPTIDVANKAACKEIESTARNFQTLYTLANGSFIVQNGMIEWRSGNNQPYTKVRDKLRAADLGELPSASSDDPNFEAAGGRFEKRLGDYAFGHATANAVAKELSDKVVAYMTKRGELHQQYVNAAKDATSLAPDKAWKDMGAANTRLAGAVGVEVKAVQDALTTGNIRERLTHIHNFFESVLGKDVLDGSKTDEIKQVMTTAGLNQAKVSARAVALQPQEKLADAMPADSSVKGRKEIRDKAGSGASSRPAKEAIGLSAREKAHQNIKGDDDLLQWNEGVKAWLINEQAAWSKLHRNLGVPIAAGPSGHTNSFMQIADYLNVNKPYDVRLAVIGHLLPIRAHSLVEVLDAAKPYGAAYTPGRGMYQSLNPLTVQELRDNVAEGKKFPDEMHRAAK